MASTTPAIEARALVEDDRYRAYRERLQARKEVLLGRLYREHPLDHPAMCTALGELRGLNFALGLPIELMTSDPRSENA